MAIAIADWDLITAVKNVFINDIGRFHEFIQKQIY